MSAGFSEVATTAGHDASLVAWFLSLTPAQRLAELESRVSFLLMARHAHERKQLQPDPGSPDPAPR